MQLRKEFGDDEDAPTNPVILIESYQRLAEACRKAGEDTEAEKYGKRVELLKAKLKSL